MENTELKIILEEELFNWIKAKSVVEGKTDVETILGLIAIGKFITELEEQGDKIIVDKAQDDEPTSFRSIKLLNFIPM